MQIAVIAGSVWIAEGNGVTTAGSAPTLTSLDADTLQFVRRIPLPHETGRPAVANLVAGEVGLWLAYGTHLYQLDPQTGQATRKRSLGGLATSIAVDSGAVRLYVGAVTAGSDKTTVSEWTVATLNQLASSDTGAPGELGGPQLAAGTDGVWIAYATGMMGQVEHRRASDLSPLPIVAAHVHTNAVEVDVVDGYVWVDDAMAGILACLDPTTGAVSATKNLPLGGIVAGDSAGLYIGDVNGINVLVPDSRCRNGA